MLGDLARCGITSGVAFRSPELVHGRVRVRLAATVAEQPAIELVEDRDVNVLQRSLPQVRQYIGSDVVRIVDVGRRFEFLLDDTEPFLKERLNGAA